jgi:hypothetical protein
MSSKMSANTKIFIPKIFDLNVDRSFFPEWQVFLEKKSFKQTKSKTFTFRGKHYGTVVM